jgi:hypothetical protein
MAHHRAGGVSGIGGHGLVAGIAGDAAVGGWLTTRVSTSAAAA